MPGDFTPFNIRAAFVHVQIGAADICACDSDDYVGRLLNSGIWDFVDTNFFGSMIYEGDSPPFVTFSGRNGEPIRRAKVELGRLTGSARRAAMPHEAHAHLVRCAVCGSGCRMISEYISANRFQCAAAPQCVAFS